MLVPSARVGYGATPAERASLRHRQLGAASGRFRHAPARAGRWRYCTRCAPVGLVLCAHHQRICLPGGVPREGGSSAEVMHKEPRSGFGKRLDFIVELILAGGFNEQPKFARPDRHSDRPLERRRAGKHAGVGGRDLRGSVISPSLYSRTKESPDRLRTEIRIDQTKSERDGIMSGVFWATEIWDGIR